MNHTLDSLNKSTLTILSHLNPLYQSQEPKEGFMIISSKIGIKPEEIEDL